MYEQAITRYDNSAVRVVVVEDDPATRSGLERALRQAGFVLKCAHGEYAAARDAVSTLPFDALLLDLDLNGTDATDLIGLAKRAHPQPKVIVISALGDEGHALRAIRGGADGFVLKSEFDDNISQVIHSALAGEPPLSPAIARYALRALQRDAGLVNPPPALLSPREMQMLKAIAMGYSHREIAARYDISYHTVIDYVRSMYRKLDVNNRSEALMVAVGKGLLKPD
ncbi:MAG: response regulator transcription factor [Pseudomonadota bacterium]